MFEIKFWFHLLEDGKIVMPRLIGAMLEIVCINYRIVHFLVLHTVFTSSQCTE